MDEQKAAMTRSHFTHLMRLIRDAKPPVFWLFVALFLSILQTLSSLLIPLLTKDVIDQIQVTSISKSMIFFLIGAFLLQAVASGTSQYILGYTGQHVIARIRSRLWNKILSLPISYFDQHRSGDLITRMTQDTNMILTLVKSYIVSFFSNLIAIVGAICILFYLDWVMTMIILIAVPIAFLLIIPLGRMMFRIAKLQQQEMSNLTSLLTQVVSEIRLVKAFGTEPFESKQGEERIHGLFRFGIKETKIQAIVTPFFGFVIMGLLVMIIGYGGIRVSEGLLTTGELIAFILLLFQIVIPFGQFASFYTELQRVLGATDRIHTLLALPIEANEETLVAAKGSSSIDIQHLYFSYAPGEPVLQNVTFTIPARKTTAIVGPSGSGKSTLFSLLEKFYVPDSGQINFGDDPIEQYTHESWRKKIGYVAQESPLLAGTIRDNIVYGVEFEVPEEKLIAASQMAYAHHFIEQLPHGYNTQVGERGIMLSGGQRQRIAIARALLRNPDILMLDEATSSLDGTSEYEVQQALKALMKDRTTVVIAHRLSTVVDSDQIVVLEKGIVTGTGTHQQLMRTHATYRDLAQKQFGMNEFIRAKENRE
jgi:ATP-binding cassette subfamily B protein AbcA/BmrA